MKKLLRKIKRKLHKINIFRYIKNYFFCLKYPFMKTRNVWTGKSCGYSFTCYDEIPYGWRKAFGKRLLKELKEALKKEGRLKEFMFTQIKEKYGELCLYNNGVGKYSGYVINKYEILSMCYCMYCGKPVRYITDGWVEFLCDDCVKKRENDKKHFNPNWHRLTVEDIPYSISYDGDTKTKIDYKERYGIDFKKLWNLDVDK